MQNIVIYFVLNKLSLKVRYSEGQKSGKDRFEWLTYGFDVRETDFDGRTTFKGIGEALEHGEWPVSLY